METTCRAYVAYLSGRLVTERDTSAVYDRDRELWVDMEEEQARRPARPYCGDGGCDTPRDVAGTNYCIVDRNADRHICLALYGRLFEGFDHATGSHFNGFVDDDQVTLYDFGASDFFGYRL